MPAQTGGVGLRPSSPDVLDLEGTIYLLHFRTPVAHARHYIGWAKRDGLFRRLAQHEAGNGASTPLVRAAVQKGGFVLARVWDDATRTDERRLKNRGSAVRLCPICKGEK